MKKWVLSLSLSVVLSSCVPSVNIGRVAQNAANRAVESAVESAVSSLVRRAVDRVVGHIFDIFIASAIDGMFGVGAEVEYGPDFALDLYTGNYNVTLGGDAEVTGEYSFEGTGEPESDADDFSLGVAIRGVTDEGNDFLGLSLIRVENDNESFTVTLIDGTNEAGEKITQIGVQFNENDAVYVGEGSLQIDTLSKDRFAGSLTGNSLTSEEAEGTISVTANFDVPINPAGSLFIKASDLDSSGN